MKSYSKALLLLMMTLFIYPTSILAQQKMAFLVGISNYGNEREDPNEWANINGANDVELLAPQFKGQGFSVVTLVDSQATYKNITNGLSQLAKSCKAGDIVYIHFSMHGQPFEDQNGDEEDGWDEALIPVDAKKKYKKGVYEGEFHLIDDKLEEYVSRIRSKIGPTGMLYVVLDACHSGEASRGGDEEHVRGTMEAFSPSGRYFTPRKDKSSNDYFNVSTKKGQSPVVFIEACRSDQQNNEIRDPQTNKWFGPLSYYISQAMISQQIGNERAWISEVATSMKSNRRVRNQNMVIEESK